MHASTFQLNSKQLVESRSIHVVCGNCFRPGVPRYVVLCVDGQMLRNLIAFVPEQITDYCLFVGVESNSATRDYDFVRGFFPDRYESHRRFIADEVMGRVNDEYGINDENCMKGVGGFSNGATFAHALAAQDATFSFAIVFSAADNRVRQDEYLDPPLTRYYLAAGTREPDFPRTTRAIAEDLSEIGAEHIFVERAADHSIDFWASEFPLGMTWVLEHVSPVDLRQPLPKAED